MATGKDVIAEAKKYLGKGGSTFWNAYGIGAADWCCMFVWYVMQKCGASKQFLNGGKTAWVPTAQEWLAKNGTKVALKDAREGDIVIFTWNGTSRDHIGFAIKPLSSSVLQTIEGNTGSDSYKTSKVKIKERPKQYIYGIYRPKYPKEVKKVTKSYGEIRKYRCLKEAKAYKSYSVASGHTGKKTNQGAVYSATAWVNEWIMIPYLGEAWVPTSGSKGQYLQRLTKIDYIVTNVSGVNIYADHTTKSKFIKNIRRGSELTVTKWYGAWGYVTTQYGSGWVAMSCLSEKTAGTMMYREMELIAQKAMKRRMKYSTSNLKTTLSGALADGRWDCAHYVSFGLQALNVLPVGQYIWLNKGINGNGADDIKRSSKVTITHPNKTYKNLSLKIGDIVGYGYRVNGVEGQHTQVFAGYDSKGYPLWFSAGTSDVKGNSYGPKRKTSYESRAINVLIRLK